ncbi:MAG: NACHT domain-containing protein, partial [Anaerolineales bacterium]
MDPITLVMLGLGLYKAFEKLLEKGVIDPALEKGLEPLKKWLTAGYDKKQAEAELREPMQDALAVVPEAAYTQWYEAFQLLNTNPALAARLAAAAIAQTTADREPLTDLLPDLKLPAEQRETLKAVLWALRDKLKTVEPYDAGIVYANDLDQRDLLRETLRAALRSLEIEEALLADRRLDTNDARALSRYLSYVREQFALLALPLARKRGQDAPADAKLDDVFVPLTAHDSQIEADARRRADRQLASRKADAAERDEVKPATLGDVLTRYPAFIFTGPPGYGKTTLLRKLGLTFAEGQSASVGWTGPALLPIFLRLRNFGVFLAENRARFTSPTHGALTAYMEHYFREEHRLPLSASFFDQRLEEGRCLVLLDGLDEVTTQRAEVAQHINAFIKHFGKNGNRFGLASRPKGYESVEVHLRPAKLARAEVNPLGPEGITQLVGNLLRLIEANPAQRQKDAADLPRKILASRDLTEIAGTPLFCTALVQVYKYHGADLPQRRVEVYKEIVDLLLGFWKAQEGDLARAHELAQEDGTGATFADVSAAVKIKTRRLSHLALWMQNERLAEAPTDRAQAELAEHLQTRERKEAEIAEAWAENFLLNAHERSGLFVEIESGQRAFVHEGFREYLAATALVNKREAELVDTILAHVADDWWEQVIRLASAHPELSDGVRAHIIERLLAETDPRHTLLAGQCAVDMTGLLAGPEYEQVEDALCSLMHSTTAPPKTRLEAANLLDALGWTPDDLYDFVPLGPHCLLTGKHPTKVRAEFARLHSSVSGQPTFIARYPVTNKQYAHFLTSEDYAKEELWSGLHAYDLNGKRIEMGSLALDWWKKQGGPAHTPPYWNDARFGQHRRLCPVVTVTWFEAAAYCAWLDRCLHGESKNGGLEIGELAVINSLISNNPSLEVRLPLESEWELAAGGVWADDNSEKKSPRYPWQTTPGETVEKEISQHANTSEAEFGATSPVGLYPTGASPRGVHELAGNVWEWQANSIDIHSLALRGGAWSYNRWGALVAYRYRFDPRY